MNMIHTEKKRQMSLVLLLTLLGMGAAVGDVHMRASPPRLDGTVLVARNSLLGGLRKIYACKLVGNAMSCVKVTNAP